MWCSGTAGDLTFVPNSDVTTTGSFLFKVTDTNGNTTSSNAATMTINIAAVTTVTWTAATPGPEDTAIALGTLIVSGDGDTNSLTISSAPKGAVLSDSTNFATSTGLGDAIRVKGWNLSQLSIFQTGDFSFTLTATATVKDANGDVSAPASATELVTIAPIAPTITVSPASGTEGSPISLNISASASDPYDRDSIVTSLMISGIPVGDTLSDGHGHTFTATNGQTSVDVVNWRLSGLAITPANDANFSLTVTATATDDGSSTTSSPTTLAVSVNPLEPTVAWGDGATSGNAGTPITLDTITYTINKESGTNGDGAG